MAAALLAFDTSTDHCSVALAAHGRVWTRELAGGPQASSGLLPAVRALLAEGGCALAALDAIAFGAGPGSFTGLRTACAVAQGLAFGAGLPVLAVDSLCATADDARHQSGCSDVVAALDARMGEVYWAHWRYRAGAWACTDAGGVAPPEAVPVPAGWTLAGTAPAAYGERLRGGAGIAARPTAEALLRLAPALLAAGAAVPADRALPRYVRDKVAQTTAERQAARAAPAAEPAR